MIKTIRAHDYCRKCYNPNLGIDNQHIHTRWDGKGRCKVLPCINGKRHNWRDGSESVICYACSYDVFEDRYRNV